MRRTPVLSLVALSLLLAGSAISRSTASATAPVQAPRPAAVLVTRGEYLVNIAGCHDCHSPKVDDMMTPDADRLLSGRPLTTAPPLQGVGEIRASLDFTAYAGPWGNSYAANLTPDRETGLGGRYTEAAFVQTIRTGRKPEGEMLAPPMPWTVYRNMTDEDLRAVYAYLTTLKPVENFVRASPALATTR